MHRLLPSNARTRGLTTVGAAVLSLLWLSGSRPRAAQPSGGGFDFSATMRVDYFHAGGPKTGETFALDRVVNDGAWAGSRTQLVDDTNLGKYLFEVRANPPQQCSTRAGSLHLRQWRRRRT